MEEDNYNPTYLDRLKKNARKYWYGPVCGATILGTGISVEVIGYRSESIGIISIVGGIACMTTCLPIKKLDEANELISTYREIRSLPEVDDFTDEI